AEMHDGLMARLSEATGRPVVYNNLGQSVRRPGEWQKHMDRVNETAAKGIRAYPLCSPNTTTQTFNMKNTQVWRGSPTCHPILLASDDEKLRAYADPEVRRKLHEEMIEWKVEIPGGTISRDWYNYIWVEEPTLEKNKWMVGKTLADIAKQQNQGIIDSFHDLVVEEKLETTFMKADITIFDPETVKPLPEFIVHDFPAGGWRFKEPAAGIYATFVNGQMLMKEGNHTGNLPGRVLRNSRYQMSNG